jgi:hypothetical protein
MTGIAFFNEIIEYHSEQVSLNSKYSKLRWLLERVCKEITAGEPVQFSNLFSRLNYACKKKGLDRRRTYQLNTFRINANKIQHGGWQPSASGYLQDLKIISETISYFYDTAIPAELLRILPENDVLAPKEKLTGKRFQRIRAFVRDITADTLFCEFEEFANDELYKVKTNVDAETFRGYYGNREFESTFKHIWAGASVNLIDVTESEGAFYAEFVVLEPDYLIDISNLAECYKEHGDHQLNYTISRLTMPENKMHFRIGDFANMCLDEQIFNQAADGIDADTIRGNAFRAYPFEYSTCIDFDEDKYREETERQHGNIRNTVLHTFSESTFRINKDKATVEPSFFCEYFGVQGRLDFFQYQPENGYFNIIELKSGKPPYPYTDPTRIGKNHGTQLFLYYLAVLYNLHEGDRHRENLNVYVLYSKPSTHNLRFEKPALSRLKHIINKRNEIVLIEHFIAKNVNGSNSETVFKQIVPAKLILERVNSSFLENYVIPDIRKFSDVFVHSSLLEREYFHSFYTFLTRELFVSKIGDGDKESSGNRGVAGLWQNDLRDKIEAGEILTELKIKPGGNKADETAPKITFTITDQPDTDALPNFRKGEVVNLYERNSASDVVTNKQIFKGAIEQIGQQEVTVRLRFKQRNRNIFSDGSRFAIEPDFLDSSYNWMFKGLFLFLQAGADRKDLLLSQRPLQFDSSIRLARTHDSKEIDEIVLKAKQAKDYFLLVGPPGTGKTSKALKAMVDEFYSMPETNILLLSYTNRAVDEICDALDGIDGQPPYVRIGNTLSCDEKHTGRLLDCLIADCQTRAEVRLKIKGYRIFVGTVSSISGKMELFRLKHFQVAIIDEASQILEPHLLGILSAKNPEGGNARDPNGRNAIAKFILIGDNKQLPAVVLQKEQDSATDSPTLNAIGLLDRRNSLFERLYNLHKKDKNSPAWGMLYKQGRMHPEVAGFPNIQFYKGRLEPVPLKHQAEPLEFRSYDAQNPLQELIATKRVVFIPSQKSESDNNKTNSHEARVAVKLVENIYALYQRNDLLFEPDKSIGIIAPYRSQIALIRRELHKLNIGPLDKIMIDTVERFQGSQRDIIIYSFSVNYIYQLNFLARNMEDEGVLIDRKLNVALTRARKQLFITGNPAILSNNPIYHGLIEHIRSVGGYSA